MAGKAGAPAYRRDAALNRPGAMTVLSSFRQILFPLLVIMIIGSLWAVGRAQQMEDDIRYGVGPSPRWTALVDATYIPAE
jgi:hypothetical protein